MRTPSRRPSRGVPAPKAKPEPPQSPRERMREAVKAVVDQKAAERDTVRRLSVAARAKAERRTRTRYWQAVALFLVFVVCLVIAIPAWRQPFPALSPEATERNARQAIVFAATLVEHYAEANGAPPAHLKGLGVELPGIYYSRVENSWYLSMHVGNRAITFTRGDNPAEFLATQ